MDTFYAKDGLFWVNEQPQLIQAGEFHYFRTPADQWAHRLGLLQQAGFNTVAAYIPWLWHQPQHDLSDLEGHTHPMRNLAGFLDLATEMGLYIIARPGPYIMAETINEGIPPWVFQDYPQVAMVTQHEETKHIASYLHPDFLTCVEGWYQAVFKVLTPRQITNGGNIIMVQLDNEMAMLQWVMNLVDINPDTLMRFAHYLSKLYGDTLKDRYPTTDLIPFLQDGITRPKAPHAINIIEDYRRFYRTYLRDYMSHLWDTAKKYGMNVPPVVNIHGFGNGGKTFPIGLSQLIDVMAMDGMISATDVYPLHIDEGNFHQLLLVNEMTKALQIPEQALFSIEFQAGGNQDFGGSQSSLYDLHTRLCVSCGMRAINHYLFFDGENDPAISPVKRHNWGHPVRKDGTLRRHYARYPELSRVFNAYSAELVRARPKTVATVGFIIDDYMTEINNDFTQPATNILTHQRDVVLFDFIARGLALTHRPFNAIELSRTPLDPSEYPLLWVMMEKQCDAAIQQKLVDYLHQGGKIILVGRLCQETFSHEPCTILQDAIGIDEIQSSPPFEATQIHAFNYQDIPVSFVETYTGHFDDVFATSQDGSTVGFVKKMGAGKLMMLGAALPANTLDDIDVLHQMAQHMDCQPLFSLSDWADIRLSEGESGAFMYINNYQDDPIETAITIDGKHAFGNHSIMLPARRGVILPLEWQVKPGILIHYLTSEVIEVSDRNGQVTLKTALPEFYAELSLNNYICDESLSVEPIDAGRISVQGRESTLTLIRQ